MAHAIHKYTFDDSTEQDTFVIDDNDVGKVCRRADLEAFFVAATPGTGLSNWVQMAGATSEQLRLVLTSQVLADFTSTGHALQIGPDGAFPRMKISPGRISVMEADNTREILEIECDHLRLIDPGSRFLRVDEVTDVVLDQSYNQNIVYRTDGGDLEHSRMGMHGNDGLGFRNFKTGPTNRNIFLESTLGLVDCKSDATKVMRFRSSVTAALGVAVQQEIDFTSDAGDVVHATIGKKSTGELVLRNFDTGGVPGNIVIETAVGRTISANDVAINTSNISFRTLQADVSATNAVTFNFDVDQMLSLALSENITTATLVMPTGPCTVRLRVTQDTVARTMTGWAISGGSVIWEGGTEYPPSVGSGDVDWLEFRFDGTNVYASFELDFA